MDHISISSSSRRNVCKIILSLSLLLYFFHRIMSNTTRFLESFFVQEQCQTLLGHHHFPTNLGRDLTFNTIWK
ncbi:uncharacterized protein M6B38_395490 [Iris pallida]|uniref:Uncharacterized protein n=1 Tax=Iris pallida TaxID=29817 RepID=A0AAX6FXP9_IRIPA|nr:uncharacterized protein M6B38_395490 [Iris pallida]